MATAMLTLPVPREVAQTYAASNAQIQQGIQQMISNGLGFFSHSPSGEENRARYEKDFYDWTQKTAALIRAGQWYAIDREALAEEVESLGKSEQRELSNRLGPLLEHLLKLSIAASRFPHDLSRAERGWRATVKTQRLRIAQVLRDNPSLRSTVQQGLEDAYAVARVQAAAALDIEEDTVPERCLWTQDEVLRADFWPEAIP